jgi:hypothetical protein
VRRGGAAAGRRGGARRQERHAQRLRDRATKDRRGRKPKRPAADPEAKVNLTDPESRVVRDYHGYFQGYNVQAAAARDQIIVAAEVTRAATDIDELQPMLAATQANLASLGLEQPMRVLLADAGYYSDANVQGVGKDGPELMIATRSDRNRRGPPPPPRGRIPSGPSLRERMRGSLRRNGAGSSTNNGAG